MRETIVRDVFAIAIVAVGFWLLRHDLFEREPQGDQAAHLRASETLPLGVAPGDSAPSRSEPHDSLFGDRYTVEGWPTEDIDRTLAEIRGLVTLTPDFPLGPRMLDHDGETS